MITPPVPLQLRQKAVTPDPPHTVQVAAHTVATTIVTIAAEHATMIPVRFFILVFLSCVDLNSTSYD